MFAAQRNVHVAATNDDLLPLFLKFPSDDSGDHRCFPATPTDGFDFFYFVRIDQHVIGTFKKFIPKIVLQSVSEYRNVTTINNFNQFFNVVFL